MSKAVIQKAVITGLALAILSCLAPAYAASTGVSIELQDTATVGSGWFRLSDVAVFTGGNEEIWEYLGAEPVGTAPSPGRQIVVGADSLLGLLAERGYDWRAISISGARAVTVIGAQQTVPVTVIVDRINAACLDRLGVVPMIEWQKAMDAVNLPVGNLEIEVRFPDRAGKWLPDAVLFSIDGRLATTRMLSQYLTFTLPVVVATGEIASRTVINGSHVALADQTIKPGFEVATSLDDVTGLTTRSFISAGSMLRLSRLKRPYDAERGATVLLLIRSDSLEMTAQAIAKSNAYIGQTVLVERIDDGEKFSGLLMEGPMVVVE